MTRAPRVCVVLSSFRSDEAILRLLDVVSARSEKPPFERLLIVESQASGSLEKEIKRRKLPWVDFVACAENIGSAGNLSKRLDWAAEQGFDYAYALNHDGLIDYTIITHLLQFAESRPRERLGVVYPIRRHTLRHGKYDLTGTWRLPIPFIGTQKLPTEPFKTYWGASNGALYVLDRVREGIRPFADFWLGWEDLAHGWTLDDLGFEQWVVPAAVLDDDYEYSRHGPLRVTEKPSWYTYYQVRNLLLTAQRTRSTLATHGVVAGRLGLELALIALLRKHKRRRLKLFGEGVRDGLRGMSGKAQVP